MLRTTLEAAAKGSRLVLASRNLSSRAIGFQSNGEPSDVLRAYTYDLPDQLEASQVRVKHILSTLNPADINVIEGKYPFKPRAREGIVPKEQAMLSGNEGVAIVEEIGAEVSSLKKGDKVIMAAPQMGTWQSRQILNANQLLPVSNKLSDLQAATLQTNPPTAYRMLKDFTSLQQGQWVIQNGGNSAVGQAAIQLCKAWGIHTINLIRDRPDLAETKRWMKKLGADHVFSYSETHDKSWRDEIKQIVGKGSIQLALNCVGGPDTTPMIKVMGKSSHIATYGSLSRQPLAFPATFFVYNTSTAHGFNLSKWTEQCDPAERKAMFEDLSNLLIQGKLSPPESEIVDLSGDLSDEAFLGGVRDAIEQQLKGYRNKKVVFRF